jgi:plastocyanin
VHQVVVDGLFDSGLLRARTQTAPGGTFTYTLAEPGTYSYYSPLDRRVTGVIRVR